jgi:uncharacterized protein DUF2505
VARGFHLEIDSSAEVPRVHAAFGNEAYWLARLATFSNGTATLDSLEVDDADTVTVAITLHLLGDRLPTVVRQLRSGDLTMIRSERWRLTEDGLVTGDLTAKIPGAPFSMTGEALISPADAGSRLEYGASVAVRIPLIGGRIESYIAGQAGKEIDAIHRFTGDWITENG